MFCVRDLNLGHKKSTETKPMHSGQAYPTVQSAWKRDAAIFV